MFIFIVSNFSLTFFLPAFNSSILFIIQETFSPGKFIFVNNDRVLNPVQNEYDLQNIKGTQIITLKVAFPYVLDFYYRLETLPMDALVINMNNNDLRLFSRNCTRPDSKTFCLEANDTITFYKCQNSADLRFTYDFNYPRSAFGAVAPYGYNVRFNFVCT